jgi:CubicO group peptidase (beta-lactamase class C family)
MRVPAAILLALAMPADLSARGVPASLAALHRTMTELDRADQFDGAVVIERGGRVIFARGYGLADPFTGRSFTPDTAVDSASLAKPVTAAAVLLLAQDGRIDLEAPVACYLPGYGNASVRVSHLIAHAAGRISDKDLGGRTNADLVGEWGSREGRVAPGPRFAYCNVCYSVLAELVERVTGETLLAFARARLSLPEGATIRPWRLAEWRDRAVGFQRLADGTIQPADSYDDERFYGAANLSITARHLAQWGAAWRTGGLRAIEHFASAPAKIAGHSSGLSWGSWYCAPGRQRCHYLGHHEGYHHMLYRDGVRRLTVAMVSNNSMAPALHQRLQRALVAYAEGRPRVAAREIARVPAPRNSVPGVYQGRGGTRIDVPAGSDGKVLTVTRAGIEYDAFPVGAGVHYVPGCDAYVWARADGRLGWLSLYEDEVLERR